MTPKGLKALNALAEETQIKIWRARNMLFLEATIAGFMDTNTPQEVARILREHAQQLEDFG